MQKGAEVWVRFSHPAKKAFYIVGYLYKYMHKFKKIRV